MSDLVTELRIKMGGVASAGDKPAPTDDRPAPEDIDLKKDIVYGPDEEWNRLDLVRPAAMVQSGQKMPVIISVHGGGWIIGDKAHYVPYCIHLCRDGFAVVSINYHLAPESKFPTSLQDVNYAFTWIMEHADEYGLDTENIFGVGDSAGGHLLGLYTCFATNGQFAGQFKFKAPAALKIKALALNCAQFDMPPEDRNDQDDIYKIMTLYLPGGATDEELQNISITNHVTKHFPPCFLMSGAGDFLFYQQARMERALAKKNVPFEMHYYTDGSKMLGHVFHLNTAKEVSRRVNHEECEYFKKFI